jgi:hypothetical protein
MFCDKEYVIAQSVSVFCQNAKFMPVATSIHFIPNAPNMQFVPDVAGMQFIPGSLDTLDCSV